MVPPAIDTHDVQGIVLNSWADLEHAAYVFFALPDDPAAARRWVAAVAERVTPAARDVRPVDHRVQLAFTDGGLARLSPPAWVVGELPEELKRGMPSRRRILGDVGESAPELWDFGGPGHRLDGLLLLFGKADAGDPDASAVLDRLQGDLVEALEAVGGAVAHIEKAAPFYGAIRDREHFGFRDGVSQPYVSGAARPPLPGEDKVATGEFLLGYPNAYGRLPRGLDRGDFGKNGTYLVFRKLEQDVVGFWRYFDRCARDQVGDANAAARRDWLAARAVGRWPSGVAVTRAPNADPGCPVGRPPDNSFLFRDLGDLHGQRCPLGSHIRRANPRDGIAGSAEASLQIAGRHRILRRGRPYGPFLDRSAALAAEPPGPGQRTGRGLLFLCFQTSIARGFEFITQLWLNNPSFQGLHREIDPVVGGGETQFEHFTIPHAQPGRVRRRLAGLQRFVHTRGGAYLFVPSLSALRMLGNPSFF